MPSHTASPPDGPAPLDVLIVGAGFGGLCMLHKVRGMGLSALVLDAADSVGGTWAANRYPGARVDIQSLEYSFSFSEELQQEWHWTERYAAQGELLRYANHVADRFALRDGIRLGTRVTAAHFDEDANLWRIVAGKGETYVAHFLVMASGPLSTPNTPAFPGLESFEGPVLHSAAWPHEPVDLKGKRVGLIGTGSSGVQMIPILAREAASLTVFQRTAAYAVPAHNGPLDPAREAAIKADYAGFRARNRMRRPGFGCELPVSTESALDASAEEREAAFEARWRIGGFSLLATYADLLTDLRANALAAEFVRSKIRQIVRDPATAALLSPRQPIGCKRLCVDSGYYETFNRPNVTLVDVESKPIEAITPHGLRAGGESHAFDLLVLATGFDAVTGTLKRLDLRGRGGISIADKWRDGPLNYLGLAVAGFPNLFNMVGAGSTSAFTSVIVSIEHHVDWIAECIGSLRAEGRAVIEATEQAERDWVAYVTLVAGHTVFLSCDSWYLGANSPGTPRMFMPLASGFPSYAERCAAVARSGYEGFAIG
ncbi:MAG: NAD(P)/FAD-dependent oxidoreductase [Caldimonas sp.]